MWELFSVVVAWVWGLRDRQPRAHVDAGGQATAMDGGVITREMALIKGKEYVVLFVMESSWTYEDFTSHTSTSFVKWEWEMGMGNGKPTPQFTCARATPEVTGLSCPNVSHHFAIKSGVSSLYQT